MKKISGELLDILKENQEKILAQVLPAISQKDYLKQLVDPAMLPLVAASFLQSLNNALEAGNFTSFRNTVDWLFQMAEANGMTNCLENNLDFLATVQEIVKENLPSNFHQEIEDFARELKELFTEVYQARKI